MLVTVSTYVTPRGMYRRKKKLKVSKFEEIVRSEEQDNTFPEAKSHDSQIFVLILLVIVDLIGSGKDNFNL